MNFHYAKSVPSASFAYNVYNTNGDWCGVVIFGNGTARQLSKNMGVWQGEVLELVRVALNGKQGYTSQAVSMALKQLHKDAPYCKMVVSFSDHRQHHLGTIYQATNWIYLGVSVNTSKKEYLFHGKWIHPRTFDNTHAIRDTLPQRRISNKFKYVYVFDKRLRKEWNKKALPYPKDKDLTE